MTQNDERIYTTPVSALKQYRDNPRIGDIDRIADSLQHNGQYKPIIVRRDTQEILAGNHTWQAAKQLGWETIKVLYVDGITDQQAAKIVLADNRTSDFSTYNDDILAKLLKEIGSEDATAGTGYDDKAIKKLLASLNNEDETYTDQDEAPPTPRTPKTKEGDLWYLGEHAVLCGSATNIKDYETLLQGEQAQLLLTDPPYNVNYTGGTEDELTIENDNMSELAFKQFLTDFYTCAYEHIQTGRSYYIFHADGSGSAFRTCLVDAGWELKQILIWVKDQLVLSRQDYHWKHEPIIYGWKPGASHHWYGDRTGTTVIEQETKDITKLTKAELVKIVLALKDTATTIEHERPKRARIHPTMKPVDLIAKLIKNSTTLGETILDPFGGSGSTLIAAHNTGRIAKLIELDPRYVDVICRRFEEHTHITPINAKTGEPTTFIGE